MIDWIIENKSWFLSGLGIFIVSLIIPLFRWLFLRKPQEALSKIQDSGRDSYIAGQNIFIANRNEVAHPSVIVRMLFIIAIVALLLSSVVFNMPLPLKNMITPEAKIPIIKKKLTLHDAYMTDFSDYPNNQRIMSDAIYTTSYSDGT